VCYLLFKQSALPDVLNSAVGDFNFKNVFSKLGDVMYKFPFSLPPYYISIIRCLGVLEGVAIQVRVGVRVYLSVYLSSLVFYFELRVPTICVFAIYSE
jgi:hypothetical protein